METERDVVEFQEGEKALDRSVKAMAIMAGIALMGLMLVVCYAVFMRRVFNAPPLWGTDVASVAASEVDALRSEAVDIGCAYIRQVFGFACSLAGGPYGAPAHVVDIEVEDVGPPRLSGGEPCVETIHDWKDEGEQGEGVLHDAFIIEGCFVSL